MKTNNEETKETKKIVYKDTDDVDDEVVQKEIDKAINERYVYLLYGKTFPIKDIIKKAGCKWNPNRKIWYTFNYFWRGKALKQAVSEKEKEMIRDVKVYINSID